MNNDKNILTFMEALGRSDSSSPLGASLNAEQQQCLEMHQLLGSIDLPLPAHEIDQKFNQWIGEEKRKATVKRNKSIPKYVVGTLSMAAVLMLLFWLIPTRDPREVTQGSAALILNGLTQLHQMQNRELSLEQLDLLKANLRQDGNIHLKIYTIQLLEQQQGLTEAELLSGLEISSHPTVQMAFLNQIETLEQLDQSKRLMAFSERLDLDSTVKGKIDAILNNIHQ